MITLGVWLERPSACSKYASAYAVSRCSRSSTSTTWPCSSTAGTGTTCPCRERRTSRRRTSSDRVVDGVCELQPPAVAQMLEPSAARSGGHVDTTLGQQLHHAGARERVPQVPPHGHQDHVCWPAVAREGGGGPNREVSAAAGAGEALTPLAVMAVTRDDDLLAVRAGRHAVRRYQHLTTSQTRSAGLPTGRLRLRPIPSGWQPRDRPRAAGPDQRRGPA